MFSEIGEVCLCLHLDVDRGKQPAFQPSTVPGIELQKL